MKKLIAMLAAAIVLLSACNSLNRNENDEPDTVNQQAKNSINRSMNGVDRTPRNINSTNPHLLDENTKIKYNGEFILLSQLENRINNDLENQNAGIEFKVIIEAEDDNTQ